MREERTHCRSLLIKETEAGLTKNPLCATEDPEEEEELGLSLWCLFQIERYEIQSLSLSRWHSGDWQGDCCVCSSQDFLSLELSHIPLLRLKVVSKSSQRLLWKGAICLSWVEIGEDFSLPVNPPLIPELFGFHHGFHPVLELLKVLKPKLIYENMRNQTFIKPNPYRIPSLMQCKRSLILTLVP